MQDRLLRGVDLLKREGIAPFARRSREIAGEYAEDFRWKMAIKYDSRRLISKIRSGPGPKRGLYIDCGSNMGQGFRMLSSYFTKDYFDYVLVEPNPYCAEHLRAATLPSFDTIELIEAAASTREGSERFFGLTRENMTSEGGSLVEVHNSASRPDAEVDGIDVALFSLPRLIAEKAQHYTHIFLKLDVEGSEYDILDDLMRSGDIAKITLLYVEFHSRFMSDPPRSEYAAREDRIRKGLRQAGVTYREWM